MTLPDTNISGFADSGHAAENVTSADDPMNRHACSTDAVAENVTSKPLPMSPAERKRRQREREAAQREQITYRSDEWRQFVDIAGIQRKAGASWRDLGALVLRELADNAADAANGAGAWIELVEIDGTEWWCVGDHGRGIGPGEVAHKFNVRRPMESTKLVRRPTRGMLGNGTRVVAGYCAIEDRDLIVDSRGMRTTLRFEKSTGYTSAVSQEPIADIVGTRVYLQQCMGLTQESAGELAQDTLALATLTDDARIYSGPSNPWWYGAGDLAQLIASAPDDKTVGDVVRDMGLALPRSVQDGKVADVTEEQANALLDELREKTPPVEPRRIGCVGKSAFNMPGYALKTTIRPRRGGAQIPVVVEAWAICYGWKRRDMNVSGGVNTYLNRSAVMSGLSAGGGREAMYLHGANIRGRRVEVKPGRYHVAVSVITPHATLVNDGKTPDFSDIDGLIATAIEEAMKQARKDVPPDDETSEDREEREFKELRRLQRKQQRAAVNAAWLDIADQCVLHRRINDVAEATGLTIDDLTVGSEASDPYRVNTPQNHRIAKWLAEHVPAGRKIHLRGLHYLLVSTPGLKRPRGRIELNAKTPYRNDKSSWMWLGTALRAARWLRYVPFDQIEDERNAEPEWSPSVGDPAKAATITIDTPELTELPDLTTLMPSIELTWDGTADRQKYNICLLGEKTGLRSILQPLAKQFSASLLLPSGEPSITMLHGLVDRAITDGRPLRILTFTDCDPTGQGIPASVGRRVQAMLALAGSKLDVQVISAGLTVEQADALGLPDSAIKETDKRAKKWEAATGRGQTEIDALLALRPDVLEKMARDAIAPFYDADLAWRAKEARDAWEAEARRIVATALDDMPAHKAALQRLQDQHAAYAEAHAEIDEVIDNLREAMEQATEQAAMPELPTLPKWQAPDVPMLPVLFDSADSFVANTRRMQQAKLAGDAEDEQPDND